MESEQEWSKERILKLIEAFKSRETLWKPEHYNRYLRAYAWEEVASEMHLTADECKRKMATLKNSYKRQKSIINEDIKRGIDPVQAELQPTFEKPYIHKAFEFLDPPLTKINTEVTDEPLKIKEEIDKLPSSSVQHCDTGSVSTSESSSKKRKHVTEITLYNPHNPAKKATRKRSVSPSEKISQEIMFNSHIASITSDQAPPRAAEGLEIQTQPSGNRDEEIEYFLKFLGAKMQNYSQITMSAVQHAISEIMFKADQNFYEPHRNSFGMLDDSLDYSSEIGIKQELLEEEDSD